MLTHLTAYPITPTNAQTLSILSGLPLKTLSSNIGWCAAYSETSSPRWQVFPKSLLGLPQFPYNTDVVSYP